MPRLHVLLCLGVSACASATDDDFVRPEPSRTFFVSPDDAKVTVRASLDDHAGIADLLIDDGSVVLDDDGLQDVTLAIHDVPLPEEIYPGNIVLTDIVVSLQEPDRTDLTLTWNAIIDGDLHPLAPQTLTGFTLDVADHGDVVDVSLSHDGPFFTYLGAVLADADVSLRASDVIVP